MATITIEIPDDLSEQLTQLGDRLPELLQQCIQQAVLPDHVYIAKSIKKMTAPQPECSQLLTDDNWLLMTDN